MIKVYIAGPYTFPNPEDNVKKHIEKFNELVDLGYCPIAPVIHSHYANLKKSRHYDKWMELDKELLKLCNVLYRIPGDSPGAEQEISWATSLGIPIVFNNEELKTTSEIIDFY